MRCRARVINVPAGTLIQIHDLMGPTVSKCGKTRFMVVLAERHLLVGLELLGPQQQEIQASMLLAALRIRIAEAFGDYGAGCVQHSLQGALPPSLIARVRKP